MRIIPQITTQFAGVVGEGMQAEICEADERGNVVNGGFPFATIVANDDESQWIELYPREGNVRIPLPAFLKAIELAKDEVHGEAYYDEPTES